MTEINQTDEWAALSDHWQEIEPLQMRDLFHENPERFEQMSLRCCGILLDYSKNRITSTTLRLLLDLAQAVDMDGWRRRMFSGDRLNITEDRAVLHVALRNRSNRPIWLNGEILLIRPSRLSAWSLMVCSLPLSVLTSPSSFSFNASRLF